MTVAAIFLDFDGVLVESVDIKTEAFRNLFSFAPAHLDAIVRYHLDNAGVSRYEKFRHIYAEILCENISDATFDALSARFSSLVIDAVVSAPWVDGAVPFLQKFSPVIPLFVISATPEEELREIVASRNMAGYFRGVFGSPVKKADTMLSLLHERRIPPGNAIYVGDAASDLNAAGKAGIRFVGRLRPGAPDPFAGRSGVELVVRNLFELSEYIGGCL